MDATYLHLLTNHVPVTVTALSLLILAWAMFSGHREHYKIAFMGFVLAGAFILVVFESGETAEDQVEDIVEVSHDVIEDHEESADLTYWLVLVLGAGGIAGLVINNRRPRGFRPFVWGLLVLGLLSMASLAYTASLGGKIRHTELNNTQPESQGTEVEVSKESNASSKL